MVVPGKAVYTSGVLISKGGIGADTREYTAVASIVTADMEVVM